VLLLCMHHIVSDGWSMGVLVREVAALYETLKQGLSASLPELPVQYADYAAWQRKVLEGEALAAQLEWWRTRVQGAPVLELPTDSARPAVRTLRGATHFFTLPPALVVALEKMGQSQGATLFMVLMAGWQALLARYSGQTDFCVGTPVAHRTRPELEGLIGFFVNTLALRARIDGDPSFTGLVGRVREESLGAFAHQDVPFDRLVEAIGGERDLSRTPLFQSLFVLQNAPLQPPSLTGLRVELLPSATETSKFDVTLQLMERGGALEGQLEYSLDLFTADTARRMTEHFQGLLRSVAEDPAYRLSELTLMGEAERQQVLVAWNDTRADFPSHTTVHQLFTEQARRTPGAVAVELEGRALTYSELDERSNQLARHLLSLDLGTEPRIGVCVTRGLELVVGMLGVLKAGGVYVPLEASYPAQRLSFLVEDSGLAAVLTQQALVSGVPAGSRPVVCLDFDWEHIARQPADAVSERVVSPDGLAYIIYTSGSTGRPKGTLLHHRGLVNTALAAAAGLRLGPGERALQLASLAFDASMWEVFSALLSGATLVLASSEQLMPGDALQGLLSTQRITTLSATPTVLSFLRPEELPALRTVASVGEALPPGLARRWATGRLLLNAYGPTETTICASMTRGPVDPARITIGQPFANTRLYVLDARLRPLPVGVPGELYIGGTGVARGYLGRPELTAERFVPDAFGTEPGARLYRTGDRARWLQDGALEYLGRLDFQVKVRGIRIELGEVEAALVKHPAVKEAVVVAREDAGDTRLVAYVVTTEQDAAALRDWLRERLPESMVPSAFVALETLPLTSNGKLDRKALPAPDLNAASDGFVEPQTPLQQQLAAVFREVLRVERVGLHDDFFLLGGHSLLATQAVTRLRAQLGVELSLRAFFEAPTVARLAERLDATPGTVPSLPLQPLPRSPEGGDALEVSYAQQRMWFMDQLQPGQVAYNMPAALRLLGPLDVDALRRTFAEVVRRHEALRTTFVTREGRPLQLIHAAPATWPLAVEDLSALEPSAREAALQRRMSEEAHHAFDLARGPMLRTALLRSGADEHVLVLCMHHIVSDGWSLGVLVREVGALYAALKQGREASLPALPIQYADYAAWERRVLEEQALAEQVEWWRSKLQDAPVLELPTDHARPVTRSLRGATHFLTLPAELTAALEKVGQAQNATLFMVLMAGWQALLARYSGQRDFCVGTSVGHRNRPELEDLIGFFVNPVAMRARLDGDPTFSGLVRRVREEALGAFAHQDVPFDRLVEALGGERDMSRTPVFQALFVLLNTELQAPSLPELQAQVLPLATDTARFDLTLALMERGGVLEGQLEFSLDLFTPDTARRMVEHLVVLLTAVAHGASEQRLSQLPLMNAGERHQVLVDWNDTRTELPANATVHQLFTAQARRTPNAVAVEHDGRTLTYAQLDERSNQVAHHLRSLGLGAESRVGVCMHRSLELPVALLGVLKAGGCYVPLDPTYPAQRLAFMFDDSGVAAVLTQESLDDELPAGSQPVVCLDAEWNVIARQPKHAVDVTVSPDHLAYVTYTSGSTGTPKGVAIPHKGVVRLLIGSRFVSLGPDEVVLQLAPLAFDASTLEIWGALLHGGRLVMFPAATLDLAELAQALTRHQVSVLWLTAALFDQMQQHQPEALARVPRLLAGGDVLPVPRVRERLAQGRSIINGYGPTEGTTFTATHRLSPGEEPGESVAIGRPISNTQVYVLDDALSPVPVGVPGELFIGGDGLARGYLGHSALTAERFVPNPFASTPGARLYRSGDRVRWKADGTLQFLGRVDFQVKVRGFRIELGEIEASLRAHAAVAETIVVVREDVPGDKRLVAYVTPETVEVGALREHLRRHLPEYMVPSAFVALESLPLSPNGKVDRKALPAPVLNPSASEVVDTGSLPLLQQQLVSLFREVLRIDRVGPKDDFFELGGHSLLATQLVTRVRAQLGVELPLRMLFEAPTVAQLAERVEALLMHSSRTEMPPLLPVPRDEALPLSFAQQRLWFLDQLQPGQAVYNVPVALKLTGALNVEVLRNTFAEIVRRHEVLRTTFVEREGQPSQRINPAPAEWSLPVEELTALDASTRDATLARRMASEAHHPFDLTTGPLLRTVLLRTGDAEYVLLLCMHHIVSDGWSMGV
ncbi:amino acid adenylation domain-containing protein, partial [Pyxidicoccus sp. 3LG]